MAGCFVVAAAAFAVFAEWSHYRFLLDWTTLGLAQYEELVLVWLERFRLTTLDVGQAEEGRYFTSRRRPVRTS